VGGRDGLKGRKGEVPWSMFVGRTLGCFHGSQCGESSGNTRQTRTEDQKIKEKGKKRKKRGKGVLTQTSTWKCGGRRSGELAGRKAEGGALPTSGNQREKKGGKKPNALGSEKDGRDWQ